MATITERIDAITGIPAAYRTDNLPAPRSVKIELTSNCNYRCGFCAHRLRMKQRDDMDPVLYRRLVDEMIAAGVEELGLFFIGESFLCEWLPDAVRYAKDKGMPSPGSRSTSRSPARDISMGATHRVAPNERNTSSVGRL